MVMDTEQGYEALQTRVAEAVAREDRGRRRWLSFLLLLMLVPLGIGAWVIYQGTGDAAWVKRTATSAADRRLDDIRPSLKRAEALGVVLPKVEEAVAALPMQAKRIDSLEQQTEQTRQTGERLAQGLARLEPALQEVERVRSVLPKVEAAVEKVSRQTQWLSEREEQRTAELERLRGAIESLGSRIDARPSRTPVDPDAPSRSRGIDNKLDTILDRLERHDSAIADIMRRIEVMEAENAKIMERLRLPVVR